MRKIYWSRILLVIVSFAVFFGTSRGVVHSGPQNEAGQNSIEMCNREAVMSAAWMYCSGEYRALCYQTYNLVLKTVQDTAAFQKNVKKPLAIVVDCDETILDNREYEVSVLYSAEKVIGKDLNKWFKKSRSEIISGAADMLTKIDAMGVEIFYVSNRRKYVMKETLRNMQKLNLPQIDSNHVLLAEKESDKQARFDALQKNYSVIAYLGDSLSDFPLGLKNASWTEACADVDKNAAAFGTKYFLLPNPLYGSWEKRLADGYYQLSPADRCEARKKAIMQSCCQ